MDSKSPIFTPPFNSGPVDSDPNIVRVPLDKYDFGGRKSQLRGVSPRNDGMTISHVGNSKGK